MDVNKNTFSQEEAEMFKDCYLCEYKGPSILDDNKNATIVILGTQALEAKKHFIDNGFKVILGTDIFLRNYLDMILLDEVSIVLAGELMSSERRWRDLAIQLKSCVVEWTVDDEHPTKTKKLENLTEETLVDEDGIFLEGEPEHLHAPDENLSELPHQEADRLVHGPRGSYYDTPTENFTRIAKMWSGILYSKLDENAEVSPEDVALMMIAVKLSREAFRHKRDNLVDAHGYLMTLQMIHEEKDSLEG